MPPVHHDHELCPEVVRLQAQVEAMERWRGELMGRFAAMEQAMSDMREASGRQYQVMLATLVTGFLGLAGGLAYILINHALLS